MTRLVGVVGALVVALLVQSLAGAFPWRQTPVLDVVLVVVVYVALTGGPTAGLLAGTCGGLVQDALASGILGIGGLAKTLVGYAVGRFGTQFIVTATVPRLLVFAAATVAHAVVFMGVYWVLGLRSFPDVLPAVAVQAVGNGLLGAIGFQFAEWAPGATTRRRARRSARVR